MTPTPFFSFFANFSLIYRLYLPNPPTRYRHHYWPIHDLTISLYYEFSAHMCYFGIALCVYEYVSSPTLGLQELKSRLGILDGAGFFHFHFPAKARGSNSRSFMIYVASVASYTLTGK